MDNIKVKTFKNKEYYKTILEHPIVSYFKYFTAINDEIANKILGVTGLKFVFDKLIKLNDNLDMNNSWQILLMVFSFIIPALISMLFVLVVSTSITLFYAGWIIQSDRKKALMMLLFLE